MSFGVAELKARANDFDIHPELGGERNMGFLEYGEISVGKNSASTIAASREAKRTIIVIGFDKEYRQNKLLGIALSAGREDVDVGENGSIIQSDNIGAIFYTTHTVGYLPPIEMSVGYGGLNLRLSVLMEVKYLLESARAVSILVPLVLGVQSLPKKRTLATVPTQG